ncbi:MAG TPA: ribonuclease III domain-containing protein [Thermoleophilaceae bacterium]|nr:ribonuclease III domain-containing protein [Thermoleophilaceae bacterium]
MDAPPETLRSLLERLPRELEREAFTHAAWAGTAGRSYERLAFLGDSVLGLAVSTDVHRSQRHGAGRLTKVRAQAVSQQACAAVAEDLGLPERLRAAAPERPLKAVETLLASERVLASVCEAVIGACYLAFGFERVAPAVVAAFSDQVAEALEHPVDYKSRLQERLARRARVVTYRIESERGPAHERSFVAVAEVAGEEVGRGRGRTKKGAEQEAALHALGRLEPARGGADVRPVR